MPKRVIATLLLTVLTSFAAYGVLARLGPPSIPYADEARVAQGAQIYAEHCAACHGANLAGEPGWEQPAPDGLYPAPPQNAHGHTWHHADAVLLDFVKRGPARVRGEGYQSRMPGFEDTLSDAEILSALAFIKSTWPLVILEAHEVVNGRPGSAGVLLDDLAACGLSLGVLDMGGK